MKEEIDSEDDKTPEEKLTGEITGTIPQGTDNTSEVLDSALKGLSARLVTHQRVLSRVESHGIESNLILESRPFTLVSRVIESTSLIKELVQDGCSPSGFYKYNCMDAPTWTSKKTSLSVDSTT
uniref:Uncharacterized protein n=1 Tax=Timema bartmani TaxID=61472 RepID=A0A7R9F8Z5_9NEOP|nr:unnamed protein product [Timema bartmani]